MTQKEARVNNRRIILSLAAVIFTTLAIKSDLPSELIDADKPPPPRPNDPRIELQQILDANAVVYDWVAYIYDPVNKSRQEIDVEKVEKTYRISDATNTNFWTVSFQLYDVSDRSKAKPQGVRVCLKDITYPAGEEKPHLELDLSGQVTVAMTLDCPNVLAPKSVYDPKALAIALDDCQNCIYIENSAHTHPDRAGGPDVASHSDRILYANREVINEVRIYREPQNSGIPNTNFGLVYAWQGARTQPAVSVGFSRLDPNNEFGVVFTIPKGFTYPYVEGVIKRTGHLTSFLRRVVTTQTPSGSEDLSPSPPVTP